MNQEWFTDWTMLILKRLMQSNLLLNTMTEKIRKEGPKKKLCYFAIQKQQKNLYINI